MRNVKCVMRDSFLSVLDSVRYWTPCGVKGTTEVSGTC